MKLVSIVFLFSLLLGQLGGISLAPGVVVYIHDILLGLALILLVFKKKKVKTPILTKPIVLFVAASLVSLLVNAGGFSPQQLGVGSLYLLRWVFYAGAYVLVLQEHVKKETWLYGLFGVGTGFAALGLLQFKLYPDLRNLMYLGWDPHFYRLFSTLLDPNFTGLLLVLTIILGSYLWEKKSTRRWVALGMALSLVSLFLTYSRSSFLALIAVGLWYAVIQRKFKILIGIASFIAVVLVLPQAWGKTLSLVRPDSTWARVGNWQQSVALIGRSPVFGFGFDTLRYTQDLEGDFISKSDAGVDSSILFVGATTGIVGLALYGYLVFMMLRVGRTLGIAYSASFIALGVHSLFVNSAFYPWVLIWFWVLTGVAERSKAHL